MNVRFRGLGLSMALASLVVSACAGDSVEESKEPADSDEEAIERDLIENSPRD